MASTGLKDIDCIIAKILAREASMEEIVVFGKWVSESEENRRTADILAEYWQCKTEQENLYAQFSFNRHKERLFGREAKRVSGNPKRGMVRLLLSVAASLLVLLAGYWYASSETPAERYVLMAQDGIRAFTLPDSSKVVLNKHSKLTYTDRFMSDDRAVTLDGEGYFEVARREGRRFTVEVNGSQIEVLGTKFNIDANNAGERIVTTLIEGAVVFRNGRQEEKLLPNHQLTFHTRTGMMENVRTDAYLAAEWKDNVFRCSSMCMKDLMKKLGEHYGVEMAVGRKYDTIQVSGAFSKDLSLEKVLHIMQGSVGFRWKMANGKVEIY